MEAGLPSGAYADSVDSLSPRSRGAESWDEPFAPSPAAKLRLMCSYGGQIAPRPHDRTLCYLGGDTRLLVVDRNTTFSDLRARLTRTLLDGRPFSLKYQLPSEDLDSLISLSTDEDLENMLEEYDRLAATASSGSGRSFRLRVFLFPIKPDPPSSGTSMGSLLNDSKSETWFVDALNNSMLGPDSASSSVNCLLSLEDSGKPSTDGAAGACMQSEVENDLGFPRRDSSGKLEGSSRRGGQEGSSAPGSPMLGTTSSFGSASSVPSLASLPPIRVRADDRSCGLEEHFSQMSVSDQQQQKRQQHADAEGFNPDLSQIVNAPPAAVPNPIIFSGEKPNPGRALSDDDRSEHGDGQRSSRHQLQQQRQQHPQMLQQQQLNQNPNDPAFAGDAASRPVYYQESRPPPPASDPRQEISQFDPGFRMQVQVTEKGYLLPQQLQPPPLQAADLLLHQQQAQQQFVQASPQLASHHPAGNVLPINSYYQMAMHPPPQQLSVPVPPPQTAHHPYNPQLPMYSLPLRQNPTYSSSVPSTLVNTTVAAGIPAAARPTVPVPNPIMASGVVPSKPELAGDMYRAGPAASSVVQPLQAAHFIQLADTTQQYVGYHPIPHGRPPPAVTAVQGGGYGYEYADVVRPQQLYYAPPPPAALPARYQAVTTGAVMADSPPAPLLPADAKQTKASS